MEQLIYEVSGIKYLLFSDVCVTDNQLNKLTERVKNYEGIFQSIDGVQNFWSGDIIKVRMLIPEKHALEFGNFKIINKK